MKFSFASPSPVVFGVGAASGLAEQVAKFGARTFVIAGRHFDEDSGLLRGLGAVQVWRTTGEPTISSVEDALRAAAAFGPDVIVAVGGGSIIDTAKAVGILLANGGEVLDYLEVVGLGKPFTKPSLPVIAVPTTSGAGAEVTANAPIFSPEHRLKASLRHYSMLPVVAIVDPELTLGCPPRVTAASGMDALTQCIEPLASCKANAFTDMLAREGLRNAALGLRAAYLDGGNLEARTQMSFTSLMGGMALANAKLGSVHGLAAPLGGLTEAPHGEICASVLPACIKMNVSAIQERDPGNPAAAKYLEAAVLLTGRSRASLADLIDWLDETRALLGIQSLSTLGLADADIVPAAAQSLKSSSMQGNPIQLRQDEVEQILREAW